ncbi:AsmA family protein [Mailhella massiliensis]|uniref:AsmA family protein n=1 Tax=Mailhella massiliensis TaxID=1903261 RepID=UPI00097D0AD2|nr:AsmA-like C-terminal region-containing protein [Mailhella massiliensis]
MRKPRLGTVLLLLWGIFLTSMVYGYLAWLQPSRLSSTVSQLLESKLGVQCSIGEVSLSLFPLPTLHASDLSLLRGSMNHMELHIRRAHIQISYFSLLRLRPVIRSLRLESPTLDVSADQLSPVEKEKEQPFASFTLPKLPRSVIGVRIVMENGTCRLIGAEGRGSLALSGIQADSRLPGLLPGHLNLAVENMRLALPSGLEISARDSRLSLASLRRGLSGVWNGSVQLSSEMQLGALDAVLGREISAPYRYFPMTKPLALDFSADFTASPESGSYSAQGKAAASATLTMNGHPVPISLAVRFHMPDLATPVTIAEADARMGDDHVTLYGNVSGLTEASPLFRGRADIHHFSLIRWFGFGRLMDPGLQQALDNITGSFESMELSPRGIVVPRLKAVVQDIPLEGEGSCREFLKPDIRISAHAKKADLNRIFPELTGNIPDMSHLPAPVLPLDEDDEPPQPSDIHVGYDIHISADEADILGLRAGGADVHVVPAPSHGTMLVIEVGNVYGGKGSSRVYLQDDIRVTADLSRVSMDGLTRDMAGFAAVGGILKKGSVDLTFRPGSGLTMLSSLSGSVKGSLEQGRFTLKNGRSLPWRSMEVNAQAKAAPGRKLTSMPPSMDFRGKWNVTLATDAWSVTADAPQAALAFSTSFGLPVAMRGQAVTLQASLSKSLSALLARNMEFTLSGKGSFDINNNTVSLEDAVLRHPAFTVNGDLALANFPARPSATGRLSFSTSSLKECAELFGLPLPQLSGRKKLESARASAGVSFQADKAEFTDLALTVDDTHLTGRLRQTLQGRPLLSGELHSPSLNLDDYMAKDGEKKSGSGTSTPLPLDFLKNRDLDLKVSLQKLRAFSTTLSHVELPVSQKNGVLSIPIRAAFPGGGSASGSFQAALSQNGTHADLSLNARCREVNMLNFSRDRGQKTHISGTGSAEADLRSRQKNWQDWKKALDGKLSFLVRDGAIISPPQEARGKSSTTDFRTMSMSAAVSRGVATCRDFLIKGSLTTVTGSGTVNLAAESIDARATVTLAGIPEMPITITGNLFKPKVTYQLIGAVTGTVGNLGSTFFDIVGGVLTAPFRLFQ